ncbi:carboxy terminal-processing peptidase [Pseudocnuella soli]|uniref:carboxy terminal-processing peptidase n=1 Tax=Pseudocnuella soli TaxID=2502779 RepID=UPI001047935C|nr:carboxy terminal-processing peptidase [Pseudocnuella soli]
MKRLPIVLLMLAAGIFLTIRTLGTTGKADPPTKYERILQSVGEMLRQGHYQPKDVNDKFSKQVFQKYLEELDAEKNIFLQEDIEALRPFETKVDDEIKGAPVTFFREASKIFNKRIGEAEKLVTDILAKPFDFTKDEVYVADSKKIPFPANAAQRQEAWRKRLKYMTLERYAELQEQRSKAKDSTANKTDAALEKEAREKVVRAMNRVFERYRYKFSDDDKFAIYVNTITQMMDPYTEFFPPADKRYFDEQLSGEFFGIGASLQYDDGNIKIASLITGSPAWKSGQIEVGDVVMKVAQGEQTPAELTGYGVEDAVKLIRGKQGSEVRLTLKKVDGTLKTVSLIREKIVQDEVFARSAVIENGASKIGYILLPEFYANFSDPNGSRSAVDVAKEVMKLKAAKVDGIVIDLRNNGGGSLYDVVQMAGLFIDEGPIVQVKDREGKPTVMRDRDGSVLYDGPLTVLVNEFSASASEIFAAAIQDYGRGVVIGSTSTFGKGTVQRSIGLDPQDFMNQNSELGSVKLTLQKFYRINGGSTQLKGVVPDVVLPDQYEYLRFREKDNPNALAWDEISKAGYKTWNGEYDLQTIKNLSNSRVGQNPVFQTIKQATDWLSKQNDREYPLQIDKYKADQKLLRQKVRQIDSLLKLPEASAMNVNYLPQDKERFTADKDRSERYAQWLKNLSRDIYLDQAVKIVGDIRNQQNLARSGQLKKEKEVKAF